jgi:carboxyl-terminal processing protease
MKMSRIRYLLIILLVAAGFVSAFLSGYFLNAYFESGANVFPILDQAFGILKNHAYLDLPETRKLEYGMIRGMLIASGDPHATFHEPVQHELASNNLQGRFGGIGLELTRHQNGEILIFPIIDGPALQAGILDGDQLLSVDDLIITSEVSLEEISAAIRGPVGNSVKIIVAREPELSQLEFNIKREEIHMPSVTWHIFPGYPTIGLINVKIIAETTPDEILSAVEQLQRKGATQFVLDLRNNGGGLLTAGVETAKLFLKEGIVLQQQYRGEEVETFQVSTSGPLLNLPMVVLVNHNTASAAEIIAGALQVHSIALLVGEPTFGKDSIQLIFDLEDESSLHITAAKWWIPGISPPLGENGLQPDVIVLQDDTDVDLLMEAAIQSLIDR